jgi:outer membrane protein, heavy metal efflux system
MKTEPIHGAGLFVAVAVSGCFAGQLRTDYRDLERRANAEERAPTRPAATLPADDDLAHEARLETILRIAIARNPDVAEARERVRAALAMVKSASRLPDLTFKYEQWAVPLARPYALNEASTLMFGLRQEFPAPGSLRARARAALEEAGTSLEATRARELDIVAQARRSYYDYFRSDQEYRIHLEHVTLASEIVELARSKYRAGKGTQQEVLRALVELSKLHTDVAAIEQQRTSARLMLNTLMARAPNAPLGPVPEFKPNEIRPRVAELEQQIEARRPELATAARATRKSEAELAAAKNELHWPSFMVGADYWYMPTEMAPKTQHAYAAMVSFNLPWISPKRWDEVRAAEHRLAADRRALESAHNQALFLVRDAAARVEAAQNAFTIVDRDLLPEALQSFEAARALFAAGQGDAVALLDAFRSYLDVRLARIKAMAQIESSLADLERAAGLGRPAKDVPHE